jgi:hypothetical protein
LGEEIPAEIGQEIDRWQMAEKFGWTLEYIDGLSIEDRIRYISIMEGKTNANNSVIKR